jgi:hypothetical protein
VEGARQGYRTARTELGDVLPVSGVDAVLAAYRSEGHRLVTAARAADLVERALRGQEFTPRLHEAPGPPRQPRQHERRERPEQQERPQPPEQQERPAAGKQKARQPTPVKQQQSVRQQQSLKHQQKQATAAPAKQRRRQAVS